MESIILERRVPDWGRGHLSHGYTLTEWADWNEP